MQHHSDRICGSTSLIFLVCCILQVFLYCSVSKMPLTSSLLSKRSPYAFVLSKWLSESIFQLTLCRKGTRAYGSLLAVSFSVAVILVPATSTVPGDSLVSPVCRMGSGCLFQCWCPLSQFCLYRAYRKYSCSFVTALRNW